MATPLLDRDSILQAVQHWSRDEQVSLAYEILRVAVDAGTSEARTTNAEMTPSEPRAKGSWRNLIGILATDQPPPTDEEVEQWLDEHRMEKYGRS